MTAFSALWRTLHKQHLSTARRAVQGRHESMFRLERDGVDTAIGFLFGLSVEPEFGREGIQRALGGVAFHLSHVVLAAQHCIVA
jgi:hypothetical protein